MYVGMETSTSLRGTTAATAQETNEARELLKSHSALVLAQLTFAEAAEFLEEEQHVANFSRELHNGIVSTADELVA